MKHAIRFAAIATFALLAAGCGHWRDEGMIEAGRGLVPPESSETSWSDNEGAWAPLGGDYGVDIHFDDGEQLAPEAIVEAVVEHAGRQGWVERLRCEAPGAWIVYYTRDKLKARLTVWKPMVDDDNHIHVMRIGEGNPWPPDDCGRG